MTVPYTCLRGAVRRRGNLGVGSAGLPRCARNDALFVFARSRDSSLALRNRLRNLGAVGAPGRDPEGSHYTGYGVLKGHS